MVENPIQQNFTRVTQPGDGPVFLVSERLSEAEDAHRDRNLELQASDDDAWRGNAWRPTLSTQRQEEHSTSTDTITEARAGWHTKL